MTAVCERTSVSPAETRALGQSMGRLLRSGDFLALVGPLGAGKTQFIKGIAAGLAVPASEPVVSPTFVLVREYVGHLTLYHIDSYRLTGPADLLALGIEELMAESGAVVALEWADRARDIVPLHACWITLDHASATTRGVRVEWADDARLAEFQAALTG